MTAPTPRHLMDPQRPVLSREALETLGGQILALTSADTVEISIEHRAQGMTRVTSNRVRSTTDGSTLTLELTTCYGRRQRVHLKANQLDTANLKATVAYAEGLARALPGNPYILLFPPSRNTIPSGTVWHDETAAALDATRHQVLPILVDTVVQAGLVASGFVGVMARSVLHMTKDGIKVSGQETDAEIILTAWTPDRTGVGWAGQAARAWERFDPVAVAKEAVDMARRSANPVAVEPGRMTVILGPAAVAQFAHLMAYAWNIGNVEFGVSPYQRGMLGTQVMDERVTIASDPADSDGGFLPFFRKTAEGAPLVPMTWVDHGILRNFAYTPEQAARSGHRPANEVPFSMRLGQGTATIESMVARCMRGIYVHRVAALTLLDRPSGLMTGVTQGGCFFIENGKITHPIKNLRFIESPFFFLNNLIDIGTPHRAAMGYTPGTGEWPLPPQITPPLMVRDFNFTQLADAVG